MPDARPDPAGRCPGASVRCRHGGRDARAEGRSEHVPVEGAEGTDSPGGAPDTFLPPGAPARFCLDGGVNTRRPYFMRDAAKNRLIAFHTITDSKREVGQSIIRCG